MNRNRFNQALDALVPDRCWVATIELEDGRQYTTHVYGRNPDAAASKAQHDHQAARVTLHAESRTR